MRCRCGALDVGYRSSPATREVPGAARNARVLRGLVRKGSRVTSNSMRSTSWSATLLAGAASCVLALLVLESATRLFDLFPGARSAYLDGLAAPEAQAGDAPALETQIHPFLGWSRRPGIETKFRSNPIPTFPNQQPSAWAEANRRANLFGYFSNWSDYRDVPPDHFVVGVFGGSVAGQLVNVAGDTLRDALRERLSDVKAPIEILNFGSGGYKQPQALISLTEMVALGVRFDLIVNLDGFNELVFGMVDAKLGRHPLLPSSVHYGTTLDLTRGVQSSLETELAGRVVQQKRLARAPIAFVADSSLLHDSALARTVAGALAQRHDASAAAIEAELQQLAAARSGDSSVASIPDPCLSDADECFELIAGIWERASVEMAAIAHSIGAQYLHALQPNQYVEGSKVLNEIERAHAFREYHATTSVRRGYPLLREHGQRLQARGIDFRDMTQIFLNHAETIYRDDCCHMNASGYAILAHALAGAASESRRASTAAPPAPDQRK